MIRDLLPSQSMYNTKIYVLETRPFGAIRGRNSKASRGTEGHSGGLVNITKTQKIFLEGKSLRAGSALQHFGWGL